MEQTYILGDTHLLIVTTKERLNPGELTQLLIQAYARWWTATRDTAPPSGITLMRLFTDTGKLLQDPRFLVLLRAAGITKAEVVPVIGTLDLHEPHEPHERRS